ncbi:MAG TPA: RecQ family zinc-binding domain-containing protein, partial [Armatimonadota bacterium]|nr:RecQ family zinc-binding domain-containing protein [Armatimonadota bacterium]
VHGLLAELFTGETELLLNLYDLSARHDLRPLVLRTALTYLELNGTLRQGTPCYVGYEIRPLIPLEEIGAQFQGEPARFVAELFAHARKGRTWYALDPDAAAVALDAERRRVVRALEYLAEHGWAELRTADLRHRYTVAREDPDPEALTAELMQRFAEREEREITRVRGVLDWVELDECQVNALARYFGEERAEPCGHCAFCRAGRPQRVPPPPPLPPLPGDLDTGGWRSLREAHPAVLGEPRQAARFLCGLSSPAVTRARLGRHALFGALAERRFGEVLKWCAEGQAAGGA